MRLSRTLLKQIENNNGKSNEIVTKKNDEIDEITIKKLVFAFKLNLTITKLNLSYSAIENNRVRILMEILKYPNAVLERIILEGNVIENEGALEISEALKINHSLTELDLSNNDIGDEGGCALAKAITLNDSLRIFNIFGNDELGSSTLLALAKALPKCNLKTLTLDGLEDPPSDEDNDDDFSPEHKFMNAIKKNYTITNLYLEKSFSKPQQFNDVLSRNAKMEELCQNPHENLIQIYKQFLKDQVPIEQPSLYLLALFTVIKGLNSGKIDFIKISLLSSNILQQFTPKFTQYLLPIMGKYYQKNENENTSTNTVVVPYNENPNQFLCKKRKIAEQKKYVLNFSNIETKLIFPQDPEENNPQKKHKSDEVPQPSKFQLSMQIRPTVFRKDDNNKEPVPVTPFYLFK